MKKVTLLATLLLPFLAHAQNAYEYTGDKINLETHYFQSQNLGKLEGDKKLTYQGMDIYGNYMLSCQHTGVATIYLLNQGNFDKEKQFKLASFSKANHANTVSFGVEFANENDKLPLVYISQCSTERVNGMNNVVYVERIENNLKTSKLMQTICFKGTEISSNSPVEWVVDRENEFLYAYSSTAAWNAQGGKHRLTKFHLPKLSASDADGIVTLTDRDVLDTYTIEDRYKSSFNNTVQGLHICDNLLFVPSGSGTTKSPSILYVWDLATRSMRNVIDLSVATTGELEDCSVHDGMLYLQTQGQLYKLIF